MNTFSIVVALTPIAVYCIVLGALYLRRRPKVVSGSRDLACLGFAMIGLFIVGPAELFFPQAAFNVFGISVWVMIVVLYVFMLMFAIVNAKPRLIVFGLDAELLTGPVDRALQQLDPGTKWLSHSFVAPSLGIQGIVERAGAGVVSQISATKREQDMLGWIALERTLSQVLRDTEVERSPYGHRWIILGFAILGLMGYTLISRPDAMAQGIQDILRN